jgi:hypothetical protein
MRSRQLETALTQFVEAAAGHLAAAVAAGAEVPFEVGSSAGRRGRTSTPLYCYHALTGAFISEREGELESLPGYAEAAGLLELFDGLDRYLAGRGGGAEGQQARVRAAIMALLQDVFEDRTDFVLSPERLRAALDRLAQSEFAGAGEVTLVATLHGLAIASGELPLARGLTIARPDALQGVPEDALAPGEGAAAEHHLLVVLGIEDGDPRSAQLRGREILQELLRALRLFGDGRVTLGALAWARVGAGVWRPLALGAGGRPHGMLAVSADQEDELRAFCSLVSRRAPRENELAWALRRFELGCERESSYEALSDYLMALRALLEPEGASSGLLPGRLAVLCATPEERASLTERTARAVALEREVIAGSPERGRRSRTARGVGEGAGRGLVEELSRHLRALLRDVICGHLGPDLATLADELVAEELVAEEMLAEEMLRAEEDAGGQAEEQETSVVAPAS